ncbi:MAG: hypothetical protein JXA42_19775 [Anaerolineales bacterium]|nr:hypothetical protein [Anaerolineales bacterium]
MRFREFQIKIWDLPAFNLNDIRKIDPDFHRQQLNDWLNREYIQPLTGGYYLLAGKQVDESFLFMLANRIYEPSYVSRESALAYYHIIPESVLGVTSVSSRKTQLYETKWGRFSYHSIKPVLMFGYRVLEVEKTIKFKIASLEKAVLDTLYWNTGIISIEDFIGLRWNRQELAESMEYSTLEKYQKIFNNKAIDRRVSLLMEYIHARVPTNQSSIS